jgi:hypothetical protein
MADNEVGTGILARVVGEKQHAERCRIEEFDRIKVDGDLSAGRHFDVADELAEGLVVGEGEAPAQYRGDAVRLG